MTDSAEKFARFLAAPESVQAAFFRELGERVEAERQSDERLEWLYSDAPESEEPLFSSPDDPDPVFPVRVRLRRDEFGWDESWDRRAARATAGIELDDASDLLHIPPADYVTRLTGEDAEEGREIRCPLPGHDERTGSFHVYDAERGWYCFGCGRGGDVYNLAGYLWGIDSRGPGFREIRERLQGVFA
jgi:hypothetical protein